MKRSTNHSILIAIALFSLAASSLLPASEKCPLSSSEFLICDVKLSQVEGKLMHRSPVTIWFNYLVGRSYPVKVIAEPYSNGAPTPNGYSSEVELPAGKEGAGALTISVLSGIATVDEIRLRVTDPKGGVLAKTSLVVKLHYGDDPPAIVQVRLLSKSPDCLANGVGASLEVDYRTNEVVDIFALPLTNGEITPYATTGSPDGSLEVDPGTGTVQRAFSVSQGDAKVDAIRVVMRSQKSGDEIATKEIPVQFRFGDCRPRLFDVRLRDETAGCLDSGEYVYVDFSYLSHEPVIVVAQPHFGSEKVPAAASIHDYPAEESAGEAWFNASSTQFIDRVVVNMYSLDTRELLDSVTVRVNLRFGACHAFKAVSADPAPGGDCLEAGDLVKIKLLYWSPEAVRVVAIPLTGKELTPNARSYTETFPAGLGEGETGFTVMLPAKTNYVLIRVMDHAMENVILEQAYVADYEFGCGYEHPAAYFVRGEVNADGDIDMSDALFTLSALFTKNAAQPKCYKAADINDDGGIDIADPVALLNYLFVRYSPPPADPFKECGQDPTPDQLTCEGATVCER